MFIILDVKLFDKRISHIKYRNNVVTGEVATVNGNGTYDVYIAGADVAYPNIPTTVREPDFGVGEAVEILIEYGNKEMPIIIGHAKKIVQEFVEDEINVLVSTLGAHTITDVSCFFDGRVEEIEGYENVTRRGFYYGTTTGYGSDVYSTGSFAAGSYSEQVTGLTAETPYHFQAYAHDADNDVHTGEDMTMTTSVQLEGWNLLTVTYDETTYSVTGQTTNTRSLAFSSDGTKMYVLELYRVFQYRLDTAWDIGTASYDYKNFSVYDIDNGCYTPMGVFFSFDGSKMYILDDYSFKVYQYTLTTPWDISTIIDGNKSLDFQAQTTEPFDMYIKADGTKLYIIEYVAKKVYQYTLNTPWDISTGVYDEKFAYLGDEDDFTFSVSFKSDGTQMFVLAAGVDKVFHYNLTTPWDVDTADYDNVSYNLLNEGITNSRCSFFRIDGTKMYVLFFNNSTIYQYSLGSK